MEYVATMQTRLDKKKIVIVVGMHRSGTSLLSNIVQILGIRLGEKLIAPDPNNRVGYYEHPEIVRLHARILEIIDRRWTGQKGTLDYPENWWRLPAVESVATDILKIIRRETSISEQPWGFKDPRASRMIPLWRFMLNVLDIEPIYVLSVRDPLAVAASIKKRDAIDPTRGQLLWLVHNLDVLNDAGDDLKCIVDYDTWFTSPEEQFINLANSIGVNGEMATVNVLQEVIRPDLRHYREVNYRYLPFVEDLYRLLKEAARTGIIPDEIWKISDDVRRSKELFSSWSDYIDSTVVPTKHLRRLEPERVNGGFFHSIGQRIKTMVGKG
jgi:hypothetical protein